MLFEMVRLPISLKVVATETVTHFFVSEVISTKPKFGLCKTKTTKRSSEVVNKNQGTLEERPRWEALRQNFSGMRAFPSDILVVFYASPINMNTLASSSLLREDFLLLSILASSSSLAIFFSRKPL